MDDGGQRENGRHKADQYKPPQGQWLLQPQPSMKQIMGLMAERDAAIHERNMAVSERKAAFAERDMAFLQRDSAIAERNNAILERDNAIATLQYQENSIACPPGFQMSRGVKHMHQQQQHLPQVNETQYNSREMQISEDIPMSPVASDDPKSGRGRGKQPKQVKATPANKKTSKSPRKVKRETEDINNGMIEKTQEWMNEHGMTGGIDDPKKKVLVKSDWKSQELGVNQIVFDETKMPPPGCSCTGDFRQCYKWGNGGWQSACCTTSISMYPLPAVPNKRHARVGGRKMSGGAFSKLLTRLAAEGRDLSTPVDLKDHWAKHGTNRYITIR